MAYDQRTQVPVLVRDCDTPAEISAQTREHLEVICKRRGCRFVCTLYDLCELTHRHNKEVAKARGTCRLQLIQSRQSKRGRHSLNNKEALCAAARPAACCRGINLGEKTHWAQSDPHAIGAQPSGPSQSSGSGGSSASHQRQSLESECETKTVQRKGREDNREKIYLCTSAHKRTLLHASTLIQTAPLGRSATLVLAAREGQPA